VLKEIAGAPAFPAPGLYFFQPTHISGLLAPVALAPHMEARQRQECDVIGARRQGQKGMGMEGFVARCYARQARK
jgi:hypothetical protein